MIIIEEARWILSHVDDAAVARRTWRAAAASGCFAATVLDLETGRISTNYWSTPPSAPPDVTIIALAAISPERREALERETARGAEVPPSPEVVEEEAVRRAAREGLPWGGIEERLERAYRIWGDRGAA
ncbi:MAG: hypothetical protein M3P49_08785 [Actinomycetota bacterium]|nr:hypothetical protein [Actinomycetota bacterium]